MSDSPDLCGDAITDDIAAIIVKYALPEHGTLGIDVAIEAVMVAYVAGARRALQITTESLRTTTPKEEPCPTEP